MGKLRSLWSSVDFCVGLHSRLPLLFTVILKIQVSLGRSEDHFWRLTFLMEGGGGWGRERYCMSALSFGIDI